MVRKVVLLILIVSGYGCEHKIKVTSRQTVLEPGKEYDIDWQAIRNEQCEVYKKSKRELYFEDPKNYQLTLYVNYTDLGIHTLDKCGEVFDSFLLAKYNLYHYMSGDTLFNRCNKEICDSLIELKYGKGAVNRITKEAQEIALKACYENYGF